MNCQNFKNHIADLCDKHVDAKIAAKFKQHIEECPECRKYYENFMSTVDLLAPKCSPVSENQFLNTQKFSTRRTIVVRRRLLRQLWKVAAVAAIFLAGLFIGMSNLLSEKANALTPMQMLDRSIMVSRATGGFDITLYVRTTPNENFAFMDPEADFTEMHIVSLRQGSDTIWRIEKENGRTIVCDGKKQYLWDTNGFAVECDKKTNIAEGFADYLYPETLLEKQKAILTADKNSDINITETDSMITVTTHTKMYSPTDIVENKMSDTAYRCITENVFSKNDGLLRSVKMWLERDGNKTLVLESRGIKYNTIVISDSLLKRPSHEQVEWLAENSNTRTINSKLKAETAEQAARRILFALTQGKPEQAEASLYYYKASFPTLIASMRGCKVDEISKAKEKEGFADVFVYYKLTHPDGRTYTKYLALRRESPESLWIVDGGL